MKKDKSRLLWGGLLILAGVLFLLQEFGFLGSAADYLWIIVIGAGSAVFLWIYVTKKEQWWAVIPGLTLLGLTLVFLEGQLGLLPAGDWSGAVFLGCIGLAFWLVYLRNRDHWWAIIPGGVLVTLAVVAGLGSILGWTEVLFFLGLAATFALVGFLPGSDYDTRWAFIPAGILGVLGLALFPPLLDILQRIWPLFLVAGGIYLLVRSWK